MSDIERPHRSVSQINLFKRCAYAYKLTKIDKVWRRPAAWLAQGSAVHEAGEAFERSGRSLTLDETQAVFSESYDRHINDACEITPNTEWWFASGPYRGAVDIERRYLIGLEQTKSYLDWYSNNPHEVIWVAPDGTPGIELEFDIDLDGIRIRGFLDAVIHDGLDVIVRDNKTGNKPGDELQLAVYAVALAQQFGVDKPMIGDYWMGRTGEPTKPYDLSGWPRERVSAEFQELEALIQAGDFRPDPEASKCRFCDVSYSCVYAAS